MGLDLDSFVHPERISGQLICPICTQVLDNPVQTPTDHLFCEDELLEWLSRSSLCPATNTQLNPDSIRRPSRIIVNMLAELQRYCPNRAEGCVWVGENEHTAAHVAGCTFRPRSLLMQDLSLAEERISKLKAKLAKAEKKIELLTQTNVQLASTNAIHERELRVYNAFLANDEAEPPLQIFLGEERNSFKSRPFLPPATEPDADEEKGADSKAETETERRRNPPSALQEILGYK